MSATGAATAGRRALLGASAVLALVLWADAPFLTAVYAYKDDWPSLEFGRGLDPLPIEILRGGRILYAYLYDAAFSAIRGLEDLRWLRLAAVLGAVACGVVVARIARDHDRPPLEAWIVGAGVALLPALQVPVFWATAFPFPSAAALGAGAGLLAMRAIRAREAGERSRAARTAALSAALLLVALHVYQPSAQFWFVAPAIALAAAPPGGLRGVVRRVVAAVAGFGVLGALHVAIFHFYVRFYPEGSVHPRATLVAPGELAAKLWWYLGEALPNALRVFVLDPLPLPALAIAAVAAVGLTLRWRRGGDPALLGLAASAALLPLAYAANLVTAANWAALRTVGASAAIVWTLAAAGALEFGGRFGERGRRVVLALLAAAVVAQAAQIRWRVAPLVAGLALDEASFVRERLRGLRRRDGIVVFRYPHWGDPGSSLVRYEEIGLPTSDAPWVAGPMLRQLYFELYGRSLLARIEVIAPEQRLPRRGLVVDMHGYLLRRRRQIAKSRGASPGESGAR